MKKYILELKYIYTFYRYDDVFGSAVIDERIEVGEEKRITLHLQEDSSFIVSAPKKDSLGEYIVLTYPNKDNLIVHAGEVVELLYDEFFDSMGDNNHNVYEGTVALVIE
ncbi:MAG: hypothetical protein IJX97_04000 [Clostridia bacterium]|nr:hypothetical protein [Clostridia bacterium]MBQ8720095.1 hypothetical protein [Clostridia bacterium]